MRAVVTLGLKHLVQSLHRRRVSCVGIWNTHNGRLLEKSNSLGANSERLNGAAGQRIYQNTMEVIAVRLESQARVRALRSLSCSTFSGGPGSPEPLLFAPLECRGGAGSIRKSPENSCTVALDATLSDADCDERTSS